MNNTFLDHLDRFIYQEDQKISNRRYEKKRIEERITNFQKQMDEVDQRVDTLEKISILYNETAKFARDQTTSEIEKLVTACLRLVFDDDIQFKVELGELRGKSSAEFYIVDKANQKEFQYKVEQSRGGGVVDIVSLALRISFFLKYQPSMQGPLVLDEPCKHLSEEYIFNIADFLKKVSDQFHIQIIMISHNQHIASISDKNYRVWKENYKTSIELIPFR